MPAIRLVSFDAFQTVVLPRTPIYVQYSQTFAPYLGVLKPESLKKSFKTCMYPSLILNNAFKLNMTVRLEALKQLQTEKPAYQGEGGAHAWWSEVIRRTAVGAGADSQGMFISSPLLFTKR